MGLNKNFWKNKKVLVTGHTGFKGSWLTYWLLKMGARIKGISLPPATDPSMYNLVFTEHDLESVFGDIRDLDFLKKAIKKFEPDIIIHMAALTIVRESYENPIETLQTNVMGTANILETVKTLKNVRAVLCITSDKCYENREWHWKYREDDPMGGWDPYSASKGCAELVVSSYRRSFFPREKYNSHGVAIATARAGNVIGGGDWSRDRLIPDCIRAFSKQEEVIIRNPDAIRPWQYILDLLHGYLLLVENLYTEGTIYDGPWNFGPNDEDEKSVKSILDYLTSHWGNNVSWRLDDNHNPHEALYLKLDSSKSRFELKWTPRLGLEEVLDSVIEWYQAHYNGDGIIREVTDRQIQNFEKLI